MSAAPIDTETDQSWREHARCIGMGELFYSDLLEEVEQARSICRSCPVQIECGHAGRHERFGVWAGQLHVDNARSALRIRNRQQAARPGVVFIPGRGF